MMSFTKTQSIEKAQVLTPAEHKVISEGLRKLGKVNMQDLLEAERKRLLLSSE